MNFEEKKNVIFRVVSGVLLVITLAIVVFGLIHIFQTFADGYIISIIAFMLTGAFILFEQIILLKGWKKENSLYKIAFNENEKVNNVPLVAVIVGTLFGVGLTILGIVVYFTKREEPFQTSMLVVLSIGSYLLLNCVIYYIYLLMFKKRPINLRKFIK